MLVLVALLGYLAGHHHSQGTSSERLGSASAASVVIDYPSDWRRVARAPGIPDLSIAGSIALAPNGDAAAAGLIVGTLPKGEPSPLPASFVASIPRLPETHIVNLLEIQAYRYAQVGVPGYKPALTLFVIPNPGGDSTALACYAPSAASAEMRACEQIVNALTLVGQSQSDSLTPDPSYAGRISAAIAALDRMRSALGRELPAKASPSRVRALATRLAGGFAASAASLSSVEPSALAHQAQAVLSTAILRAHDAYTALASAAAEEEAAPYASARKRADEAESGIDTALENFALLGYAPAIRAPSESRS